MGTRLADFTENTGIYGIIATYQEQRQVTGQLTLDQHIGVRIPGGQPIESKRLPGSLRSLSNPQYDAKYDIGISPSVQRLELRSAR